MLRKSGWTLLSGVAGICLVLFQRSQGGDAIRPRGVRPEMAYLYDASRDFQCLDGSQPIPFLHVNDDYCDCHVSTLCTV